MAVAVYTTDLTTINTAEAVTNWAEPSLTETLGGLPALEPDYFIQGSNCISKSFNGVGVGGQLYNNAAGVTIPSPGAYFAWMWFGAPTGLDTLANGGMRLCIGSSLAAYKSWWILGSDTYALGGWKCVPVDPAVANDSVIGAPTSTLQYFGMTVKTISAIAKGQVFGTDVIRYGRGTLQTVSGEAGAYGTFAGAVATAESTANRWGLLQFVNGSYLMQGHFLMGVAATAVDFRTSNVAVFIQDTTKVISSFNTIEIRHASSRVDWTSVAITALGTVSRGTFTVTDNADVNLLTCTFTDMGAFNFLSATGALDCIFRRTDTITAPGSDLRGSLVDSSRVAADTSAVVWNVATNPTGLLDGMSFVKGTNAHHAIEFGTSSPTTIDLVGHDYVGFNASNGQNDSVLHIKRTTGTVTVNVSGGGDTPSYKTAGATVVISSSANLAFTGLIAGSEVRAYTGTDPATSVEIGGTESSGTTFNFSQSSNGVAGYIIIHKEDYVSLYIPITYGSTDQSLPIQQALDRQYANP